jgi:hypothetical protein
MLVATMLVLSFIHSFIAHFLIHRGLFIIDDKGNLRQITINDLPVGRNVDEVLRLVQGFQFTDKHGEGNVPYDPLLDQLLKKKKRDFILLNIASVSVSSFC